MRKNDVRKWIHAALDMLPLLIIPIFAIFVRNENYSSNMSVTTGERITRNYDFNQLVKNGLPTGDYDAPYWTYDSEFGYVSEDPAPNNYFTWGCEEYQEDWYETYVNSSLGGHAISGHQYLLKYDLRGDIPNGRNRSVTIGIRNADYEGDSNSYNALNSWVTRYDTYVFNFEGDYDWLEVFMYYEPLYEPGDEYYFQIYIRNLQLFDLTQMYGSGYEPSITTFKNKWTDSYYDYTLSTEITDVISDTTVTYNDTDVGSQMVYTLYNTVDKYFNFNNVFNFNQIWNWLETNIFLGNAPLSAWIVWNVFLYEFLMDLIFLLYALFMFFIDFCTNLIDRFYTTASGGRRK